MSFNPAMHGQSPHSSSNDAAESTQGTPDTRFTAFSPEDARAFKLTASASTATPLRASQHDPFVTTTSKSKAEQKLSATASSFQPFSFKVSSASSVPTVAYGSASLTPLLSNPVPGTVQYLDSVVAAHTSPAHAAKHTGATQHGIFTTDTGATRCIKVASIYQDDVLPLVNLSLDKLVQIGFSIRGSKRIEVIGNVVYLRLSNINEAGKVYTAIKLDHPKCAVEYISAMTFGKIVTPNSKAKYSAHEGQVVLTASYPTNVSFDTKEFEESLRALLSAEGELHAWQKLLATEAGTFRMVAEFMDAAMAVRAVQRCHGKKIDSVDVSVVMHTPDISSPQVTTYGLAPTITPTRRSGEQSDISDILGQMSLSAHQTPRYPHNGDPFGPSVASPSALSYMTTNSPYGLPPNTLPVVMNGMYSPSPMVPFPQGYSSPQGHHNDDGFNGFPSSITYNPAMFAQNGFRGGFNHQGFYSQAHRQDFSYRPNIPSTPYAMAQYHRHGRRQNNTRGPHNQMNRSRNFNNPAAGHHNHVDINRIRQGIDVRTTVMLRNIPNKVDQAMLKSIVDESSHGKYDFMYLRIDFSNNCNVGYAFINFTDPLDIIEFVLARSNQKWHRFKSDKVAEVSYATIQGRDCLIQKFRNSSVMLEPPHYRPKLFFTANDPFNRVGEEDEFPPSDNASKLKRSCENAEHVGLFAPSAGQHLRDEQRRRRSQYDRGTSLAEREEYGYDDDDDDDVDDDDLHHQNPYQGFPPGPPY